MDDKQREWITALFLQAWWNDLVGNKNEAKRLLTMALTHYYSGHMYPAREALS